MGAPLVAIPRDDFARDLQRCSPEVLTDTTVEALWLHYQEVRRWAASLSLVGPGTVETFLERHYGEALAALPHLPSPARSLVDIGSGAGFPGFVLAAARPDLRVFLVESMERKWAFLRTATRRASLPCTCLNARVAAPLPEGLPARIDVVTLRALRLPIETLAALAERMDRDARMLLWQGAAPPELPPTLEVVGSHPLAGAEQRRILVIRPALPERYP